MLWRTEDTIAAIASAAGGAPRGIVRISGPDCLQIVAQCLPPHEALAPVHQPHVLQRTLTLENELQLACSLYIWPKQRSYTQQPTLEIHTVGSPPLLEMLLRKVCQHGARLAEPGEFTLRAFLAGRLDLTQAEAVLGVIDAESQRELQVALQQLAGGMTAPLAQLRSDLLNLLADVEAELDFVEEDLEFVDSTHLRMQLNGAHAQTAAMLNRVEHRSATSSQTRIVLYGSPNAGKSSLFNALTHNGNALVSEIAGTTRDYLSAEISLAGISCLLLDTAGVCETSDMDSPAAFAQDKMREQQSQAQLRILCIDGSQPLDAWSQAELARTDERCLVVFTKCDLPTAASHSAVIYTSSKTGAGLEGLAASIAERLANRGNNDLEVIAATAARCRESLTHAVEHLAAAIQALQSGLSREFLAGDLRLALDELGRVAGTVVTDDILDRIFSRFCIGK